jgi:Laminin B (Domain IV)
MGDAKNYHADADFSGSGGNPGGLITAKDDEQGGTVYFVAPCPYVGDHARAYGQQLRFDLKTTMLSNPYKAYGVMLSGGGTTVVTPMPYDPSPANQWRSYAIALDTSVAWKVVSGVAINAETNLTAAPLASESDLRTVLAALTTLRIRAEYNAGPDTGSLDNVHFGE